jgi:signal transduction histidine kinase
MAWPRGAARVIAAVTGLVVGAEVAVAVIAARPVDRVYISVAAAVAAATTGLGVLVAARRPTNAVAPLLCFMALLAATVSFSDTYPLSQSRRPDLLPALPAVAAAILVVGWVWLYIAVGLLMLAFPDGHLPSRGWRWVAVGLLAVGVAVQVVMAISPGPYDAPFARVRHPFGDLPGPVALGLKAGLFPILASLVVTSLVSLGVRYRRSDGIRKAQLKWFALAGLALPFTLLLSWFGLLFLGNHDLAGVGFDVLYVALPAATAVAILRHDLYDVDRALSAAVTYGTVTAGLLVVFTGASFTTGLVFGRNSAAAAAAITAVSAFAFVPVRARLQRQVDRRLYPLRRAALQAIDELRTLSNSGQGRPEQLEDVLRGALRDTALHVGYLLPGTTDFIDATGQRLDLANATPVRLNGQQIGAITSGGPASRQLLRDVAAAIALLVEMVRLRLEVSAALREVESSRMRLQQIGYQERRRLERDLHDGAQQRLVSLGMALRLAQRHLPDATVDVDALVDQSVAELGTAIAELRQVAHGLRPSCLDDGLHPALSLLAQSVPLPIDLDFAEDRALPDDIATTAYYVVSEAVTNAVKHAAAGRIGLRIAQDSGQLCVRVEDDGRGGAAIRPGSGLAGILDRVAAAGGSLFVQSPPGSGTVVQAVLPCAP